MRGTLACRHNEEIKLLLNFTDLVIILDQVTERVKVCLRRGAPVDTMDTLDKN